MTLFYGLELYDSKGNYLTEITLPSMLGLPAAVMGDKLYFSLKSEHGGGQRLSNPLFIAYKLAR
ncbi:MAG: hypothetical protein ACP5MI_05370 [Candidatus Kryptoniota bacterium]